MLKKIAQKSLAFFISLLPFNPPVKAEYRAFLLQIKAKTGEVKRSFESTLDPEQYRGYFSVQADEKVAYTDTWMCRGRTGSFQKICDNPKKEPKKAPVTESPRGPKD